MSSTSSVTLTRYDFSGIPLVVSHPLSGKPAFASLLKIEGFLYAQSSVTFADIISSPQSAAKRSLLFYLHSILGISSEDILTLPVSLRIPSGFSVPTSRHVQPAEASLKYREYYQAVKLSSEGVLTLFLVDDLTLPEGSLLLDQEHFPPVFQLDACKCDPRQDSLAVKYPGPWIYGESAG